MTQDTLLLSFPELGIYARQFEVGARTAAEQNGLTIVIDVFRASNTMLELLTAGAQVRPVTTVEEADDPRHRDFIKVGEDEGRQVMSFAYDNSPVAIHQQAEIFKGKKVVLRTTNGTRGIISALGSREVVVGTFRNFSSVVELALQRHSEGLPISFVAMGTLEVRRIEDEYCARMFVIRLLEELQQDQLVDSLQQQNPFLRDWRAEIMDERGDNPEKREDYLFSLEMDTTSMLPIYNPQTGFLEELSV